MEKKLAFDIPSDGKILFVISASLIILMLDVLLFGSLVKTEVVPSARLAIVDRLLLAGPLCGLLWSVSAGFGRKHTAGYYFRYRYGQTLSFVLFFTAVFLNEKFLFGMFPDSAYSSYGSTLFFYYFALIFMFLFFGLIASVVVIPIILWRSKIISARSASETSVTGMSTATDIKSSEPIPQDLKSVLAESDQSTKQLIPKRVTETKPTQEYSNKMTPPDSKNEPIEGGADELYAIAWNEVETENLDKGLWARLFVEKDGDEGKTKVAYISARAKVLIHKRKQELEKERRLDEKHADKVTVTEGEIGEAPGDQSEEDKEEEELFYRLKEINVPLSFSWIDNDDILTRFQFRRAVKKSDIAEILRLIRLGVNPNWSISEDAVGLHVPDELEGNDEVKHVISVACRLWDKGILTNVGLRDK